MASANLHEPLADSERASSIDEASLLISLRSVSTQLEAVCLNGKCTHKLIESLVDMVANLTKEVTDLKNDNVLLKHEIQDLHALLEASVTLPAQRSHSEQRILPAAVCHMVKPSKQRVSATDQTLPAAPAALPAGSSLTELSYRDVVAAGISPSTSGTAVLPAQDGFITVSYKEKKSTSSPHAVRVKHRRQPQIGVGSSLALPVVRKPERTKALFVSRFSPEVTAEDLHKSLEVQLCLKKLVCTKLKTKFNTYSSFHISVTEDQFSLINDTGIWPSGCLIAPYYGKLSPEQIFTTCAPDTGTPSDPAFSAVDPACLSGANGCSLTSN
jgi:hypothetical protein